MHMFASEATHVLADLLTGIGFLGAGVIVRIDIEENRHARGAFAKGNAPRVTTHTHW